MSRDKAFSLHPLHASEKYDVTVILENGVEKVVNCDSAFNILANLKAKGVDAPSSCTNGTCNTCAALVVKGLGPEGNEAVRNMFALNVAISKFSAIVEFTDSLLITLTHEPTL